MEVRVGSGGEEGEGDWRCWLETLDKSCRALTREKALSKSSGGEENACCGDRLPSLKRKQICPSPRPGLKKRLATTRPTSDISIAFSSS